MCKNSTNRYWRKIMGKAEQNEQLRQLAESLSCVTGLKFVIYDANRRIVASKPDGMCTFCTEIRRSAELTKRCLGCDAYGFDQCDRTQQPCTYHCHMNVLEVVAPIMDKNYRIGYVMIGQFLDYDDRSALHEAAVKTAAEYRLDEARLHRGIEELRSYNAEYLHAAMQLLEMSASYIWMNQILTVNRDSFTYNLDCYIREHLNEELSVERLCRTFGLSTSAMYQLARRQFGCGISAYINHCRVERAKQLLNEETISVGEVAAAVGIYDANYFIRLFKKETGITPKKYQGVQAEE